MKLLIAVLLLIIAAGFLILNLSHSPCLKIGSKRFTESYILGEILTQMAQHVDEVQVEYKSGLGNTEIVFTALKEGLIDLYPEYTGTLIHEILKLPVDSENTLTKLKEYLLPLGLDIGIPFGFNNTYALAIPKDLAEELHISRISDLKQHSHLQFGLSQEFMNRPDGWQGLKDTYSFNPHKILGIDHSLAYEALAQGQIDVMDIYSTDPKIEKCHLIVLEDDKHFFPVYEAMVLYRLDIPTRFPRTWQAFQTLQGTISESTITDLNVKAEFGGENFMTIARQFLALKPISSSIWTSNLGRLTQQHLFLVFGSLLPAIFVGIPLGILATNFIWVRHIILNGIGVIQTIPSLALLAFLIPLLQQIGTLPALIALFLYALLPIVRNTYTGLVDISKPLKESSIVLGLPFWPRLTLIDIPLASRSILAGIKMAAVSNVGMATIAAFIGAGGYGEKIVAGLALNDHKILLAGAIPACILAIVIQISFDWLDRFLIPKGLK